MEEKSVQRSEALCDNHIIGIESIFTVIRGKQINIPGKVEELREKSREGKLFCPCGCGAQLVLVAGDRNLRKQHFRLKDADEKTGCSVVTEGPGSVDSKIILKCWLDEKLKADDLDSRVQIHAVDDINRKYEFTFLSRGKQFAINYCYSRMNINDEKLSIIEDNTKDIRIMHVVDVKNRETKGQYPEFMIKIQKKQGYCLFLEQKDMNYKKAMLSVAFYAQNTHGEWCEVPVCEDALSRFSIKDGKVLYGNNLLDSKVEETKKAFAEAIEEERKQELEQERQRRLKIAQEKEKEEQRRLEEVRQKAEREKQRQKAYEEYLKKLAEEKAIAERKEQERKLLEARLQKEAEARRQEFGKKLKSLLAQQDTIVKDEDGNRWIKCESCEKISTTEDFSIYGGAGRLNLGICKECMRSGRGEMEVKIPHKAESNKKANSSVKIRKPEYHYETRRLSFQLVPSSAWYKNLRSEILEWNQISAKIRRPRTCCICEGHYEIDDLHAHEVWKYDDKRHIQILENIIPVCESCHNAIHIGRAGIVGKFEESINWYIKINAISKNEAEQDYKEATAIWEERSRHKWIINKDQICKKVYELTGIKCGNTTPINGRYYAKVPYEQKDDAKKMGAKWDPDKRMWYFTDEKKREKWEAVNA